MHKVKIEDRGFFTLPHKEMYTVLNSTQFNFFGLSMQQHPLALWKLNHLLTEFKFSQIIEIGAGNCGLSYLFALWAKINDKTFKCYDLHRGPYAEMLDKHFGSFRLGNALEDPEVVEEIKKYIQSDGRTLLLCDAGKAMEFNLYSDHLKIGDMIMTHDFVPTQEQFDTEYKNKIWNWMENWYDRIEEACLRNNIVHTTYLNDVAWSCGWKEAIPATEEK